MARAFLNAASAGDNIEDIFVITGKQLSTTATGKPFIKCFVGDRTRQISARMWNASQPIFNAMPDGGFLRIAGRVENYQDNLQFIIDRFWIIDDPAEIVLDHLLPHTAKDIPAMFARVADLMRSVRNSGLRALLDAYLADEKLMADFRKAPAAMTFHHAYIGGLLEHTLNAAEVADAVCRFYPTLNRDLVVAGVILHDLAKTWELTYSAGFGYSDGGHLVGHVVKGSLWLEDKAREAEKATGKPLDRALVDVMHHIILSHHGEPEYGAARVPATPEAIAVHMIENMDAKLTMALGATRTAQSGSDGPFTDFQKALGVKLYRPDVAPADLEATQSTSGVAATPSTVGTDVAPLIATPMSTVATTGGTLGTTASEAPLIAQAGTVGPSLTSPSAVQPAASPARPQPAKAPAKMELTNPLFEQKR